MGDNRDSELLSLFKNEESRHYAFDQIVRTYQEKLYWHIRRIVIVHDDADDVLQNTFIKIWKGLHDFRGSSQLFTWLYRIATNEALRYLKKKRRRMIISTYDVEEQLRTNLVSDEYFDGDELQMKLQQAILTLPEKQRIVFNMKYYDEMKYEEMADILQTSIGALKASYHHAVKKIEKIISED